jgi:septal ring factor EnvC (AmiA/AmiB activator)
MNEDPSTPYQYWPLIIALLASLLAIFSMLYAYNSSQQLAQFDEAYQAHLKDLRSAQYSKRLSKLEQGIQQNNKAIDRARLYSSQHEKSMQQLMVGVESNRDQLVELVKELNLKAAQESGMTNQLEVQESQSALNSEPSLSISEASPRVHRIESGDNFARIAKAYNVRLQSLLDANPSVDPRRLQIGQEVLLPDN